MTFAECRRIARSEGLAPALSALCTEVLPGMVPCGPGGHAVVPAEIAAAADRVWLDDKVSSRADGTERVLSNPDAAGGPLVLLHHVPGGDAVPVDSRDGWERGLVWLRLGLSEGLLDTCVGYLGGRASGESTLLHQQMVKGSIAEVLIETLAVHAALADEESAGSTAGQLTDMQEQITQADRALLRLLGASGFIMGGPGEAAYLSELLAEAHSRCEES
jgi:hypothetical protein